MKLMKKLINKGRLFTEVVCIGILFSFCANSATINVTQGNAAVKYTYNNIQWTDEGGQQLNAATLCQHLMNIKNDADGTRAYAIASALAHARTFFRARTRPYTRARTSHLSFARNYALACVRACIRELARMLLAQISADGRMNHNVAENNNPNYTIVAKVGGRPNYNDIFLACDALKNHMLIHGHLGYFPFMKNDEKLSRVETFIARGIFNIPFNIASRITNDQRRRARDIFSQRQLPSLQTRNPRAFLYGYNITNDVIHLSPNILADTELPAMFAVDPGWRGAPDLPNLESVANGLIDNLLSGNNIVNVHVSDVRNNRFTLDVEYNFPNPIPDTTQTNDIGYKMDGTATNTVRIVVQVQNGKISIVTMYPLG